MITPVPETETKQHRNFQNVKYVEKTVGASQFGQLPRKSGPEEADESPQPRRKSWRGKSLFDSFPIEVKLVLQNLPCRKLIGRPGRAAMVFIVFFGSGFWIPDVALVYLMHK